MWPLQQLLLQQLPVQLQAVCCGPPLLLCRIITSTASSTWHRCRMALCVSPFEVPGWAA
jgi:hypothetical protein